MPEKKKRQLTTVCTICNGPSASHLHYGAVACYSCRAFFRRGIGKPYCCVEGTGDCTIDWSNRRSCQWCRFDRCLKAGMKPELVDAAFRKKSFRKKSTGIGSEDSGFIENLHALDKDDISEFFQDISGGSSLNLSQSTAPGENIHSMDSVDLGFLGSSQNPEYMNYMSPSYSMSSMSSSSLSPCEYGSDGYTINISITDIDSQIFSLPEGVYQTEYEPELNNLEQSFTAMNTLDNFENNDDSDDSDEVKNNFDIEALVDECFVNHPNSAHLHS